jgi:hypothetical protein
MTRVTCCPRTTPSRAACAAALGLGVLLASGCASSDPQVEPAPTPNVVTIAATDYAYDAPAEIPAGVTTFRLETSGQAMHHAIIVQLDSGKTFDDLMAAFAQPGPPPAWAVPVGGPNAPAPGGSSNATIDLAPGDYAIICMVDLPGGVPHIAHGMSRPLRVVAAAEGPAAPLPTPDVRLTLSDYHFEFSAPVTAGRRTFEVVGAPGQPHEVELVRLEPGKSAMDVITWAAAPEGPPPGTPIGGTAPAIAGRSVFFEADLAPGTYALICFLPDPSDGKPHFTHGMIREFTVE